MAGIESLPEFNEGDPNRLFPENFGGEMMPHKRQEHPIMEMLFDLFKQGPTRFENYFGREFGDYLRKRHGLKTYEDLKRDYGMEITDEGIVRQSLNSGGIAGLPGQWSPPTIEGDEETFDIKTLGLDTGIMSIDDLDELFDITSNVHDDEYIYPIYMDYIKNFPSTISFGDWKQEVYPYLDVGIDSTIDRS